MSRSAWAVAVPVLVGLLFASPLSVQAQSWKGLYAGVNLGATWGTFRDPVTIGAVSTFPAATQSFEASARSFTGGVQVGYDWQFGHWVFGPEADFDSRNLNGTETVSTSANDFVAGDSFSATSHTEVSVVGQVGHTWGKWLIYGTAGPASARTTVTTNFAAVSEFPAASGSRSAMLLGATIGAGFGRKIADHWSAGAEYRYSFYRHYLFSTGTLDSYTNPQSGGFLVSQVTASVGLKQSEFLVKLNYKF
jgi:outer membrane immunogenic protein